jgi:hypothetical protein
VFSFWPHTSGRKRDENGVWVVYASACLKARTDLPASSTRRRCRPNLVHTSVTALWSSAATTTTAAAAATAAARPPPNHTSARLRAAFFAPAQRRETAPTDTTKKDKNNGEKYREERREHRIKEGLVSMQGEHKDASKTHAHTHTGGGGGGVGKEGHQGDQEPFHSRAD